MGITHRSFLPCTLAAALLAAAAGCDSGGDGGYDPYQELTPLTKKWPRFRGPGGQGVSTETTVPTTWDDSSSTNIRWKVPVPLPGASSPVVCGDRVFLSGADDTAREVCCFDADTGDLIWRKSVVAPGGPRIQYEENYIGLAYAASTVASDGVCVFAIFGNGDLACFDYEGNQIWVVNLGPAGSQFGPEIGYGHASSLLVHGEQLIVQLDQGGAGEQKSGLLALNVRTGQTIWEKKGADRPVGSSWASPIVINAAGKDQLVTRADPWLIAYDLATREEIWRADCPCTYVVASPVYVPPFTGQPDGLLLVVQDEMKVFAISPGGEDVVTGSEVWTYLDYVPNVPSPVSNGELVFFMYDYGHALTCLDVSSGAKCWEQNLSESGVKYYPSPVLVGDRVYLLRSDGTTIIFRVRNDIYEEIGRPQLGTGETYDASPAFANGRIYVRGSQNLYCIGN